MCRQLAVRRMPNTSPFIHLFLWHSFRFFAQSFVFNDVYLRAPSHNFRNETRTSTRCISNVVVWVRWIVDNFFFFAAEGFQWIDWPRHEASSAKKGWTACSGCDRRKMLCEKECLIRSSNCCQTATMERQTENLLLRFELESEIKCSTAPVVPHAFTNRRTTQLTGQIRHLNTSLVQEEN